MKWVWPPGRSKAVEPSSTHGGPEATPTTNRELGNTPTIPNGTGLRKDCLQGPQRILPRVSPRLLRRVWGQSSRHLQILPGSG